MSTEKKTSLWAVALFLRNGGAEAQLCSGYQFAATKEDAISLGVKAAATELGLNWLTIHATATEIPREVYERIPP